MSTKKANKRKSPSNSSAATPALALPLVPLPAGVPIPVNLPTLQPQPVISLPPRNQITSSAAKNVPAFLNKLYNMVSDPSSDLIHWSEDGQAFIVEKHEEFAQKVLPRFFKHNNFSSFVRQLNMYGFHKVPHLQQGALIESDHGECWEFANPHFQRNQPDLLCLVTRKKSNGVGGGNVIDSRSGGGGGGGNGGSGSGGGGYDVDEEPQPREKEKEKAAMDVNALVNEISAIKRHQVTISTDLKTIQRENQALWNDTIVMREQYRRQQETIDKIVRFLATVFEARNKTPTVAGTSSSPNGPPKVGAPPMATTSSSSSTSTSLASGSVGLGSGLDFLGLGGGVPPVGMGSSSGVETTTPMNKKRKLLLAGGNEYGGGTTSGIVVDEDEFLNFDSFNTTTVNSGGMGAGASGVGGSSSHHQKRMASLPSSYGNGLELLDDKIFELIQSPPFDSAPIITSANSSPQHQSPPSTTVLGTINPTQQKIQDVQQKAVKIQEEIDLLDDHLLNASALLGIDELDALNMDELFGTTSGVGSGIPGVGVGDSGMGVGSNNLITGNQQLQQQESHVHLEELGDDDWF
ncbi:UNVERIFIED_CONTAM: stress-responsive transcription factor hsf1 [Siphonaria sp. JEL0065]|nr:stress-responsive transcription factor hsf1 [Siphonaria sp. JEL0065]